MPHQATIRAVIHQALIVSVLPAALATLTTGALVTAASRAYINAVAADSLFIVPWPTALALTSTLTLTSITIGVITANPAKFVID